MCGLKNYLHNENLNGGITIIAQTGVME